ncbi:MAG: hypothetical protein Q9226_004742, partial [Calogaya cf. arnoldii]
MMDGPATSVLLNGIAYYVHPALKGVSQDFRGDQSKLRPVTVISTADRNISKQDIVDELTRFFAQDDVYSEDFASTLVIQIPTGIRPNIDLFSVEQYNLNNAYLVLSEVTSAERLLPSGPYFTYNNGIYEAWRLYPDTLDAFEIAVVPQSAPGAAKFSPLQILDKDGLRKCIAVPSRLYAKKSQQHPLAGARISVKDNFKLAGIKTTMTNRAFTELYPADSETAEFVKTLLGLGAVVVGKSKMSSFAVGENPRDWIDFQCPFNPRGDGYQNPSSSTTGGAASLAGYSWLDYSIGTDKESKALPTRILYPKEFFPVENENHQKLLENYICVLENHLKTSRTEFSLVERWERCPPAAAEGKSLQDYLGN